MRGRWKAQPLFTSSAIPFLVSMLWLAGAAVPAARADTAEWAAVVEAARGQSVYFNAWGGDPAVNGYIQWAAGEVAERYDVRLVHVKVVDIAESVSRIMAERLAGRESSGSVDLLWINGENFAALKQAGMLWGPWAHRVPNAALIDWRGNPTTRIDVGIPTEGMELPWGTSVFTLFYDGASVAEPPRDPGAMLRWISANPGRFTYPQPPSFLGTGFLKQMLIALRGEKGIERLQEPAGGDFAAVTEPLWEWLDEAHPHMWRSGRLFPRSGPAQRELLEVGELDWMMSYSPSEASRAMHQRQLQATVRGLHFSSGALANSHFLAIPANARGREGAMLVANFLVSPQAQAKKSRLSIWGDATVLDLDNLASADRARFRRRTARDAVPPPARRLVPEPDSTWSTRLERAWLERYVR